MTLIKNNQTKSKEPLDNANVRTGEEYFRFETFKEEILKRAKEAEACTGEYRRALNSDSFRELISVIKDNIVFCVSEKLIDEKLIKEYESKFEAEGVYCNKNVGAGLLLAFGNASVSAWGDASVRAFDNASVKAWDNATVEALDNANVEAWGDASVKASENASVKAWDNATVEAFGNATYYYASEGLNYEDGECRQEDSSYHDLCMSDN